MPLSSKPASPERVDVFELLRAPRPTPLVIGIINVTGDSFFPGSRTPAPDSAVERALALAAEGADMLDIGGQSTRPGSEPIATDEELARVIPVIEALASRWDRPISIDTDKAEVARLAREAGASVLNDVSAFRNDEKMVAEAKEFEAVIMMHRGGESPKTMQTAPSYNNVVAEVKDFLKERIHALARAGGDPARALIDPGIGFGKDIGHNLSLIKHLKEFAAIAPVVLGVSRKSFLGKITPDKGPEDRLEGSLAAAVLGALAGVKILRVHDVGATKRALAVLEAVSAAR